MADDYVLSVILELGVDANKARQGAEQINVVASGLQNAQKQADHASSGMHKFLDNAGKAAENLTKIAEKAAKSIAVIGGGLFGAAAGAASAYGAKFNGVEADATKIVAAQKSVSDAFTDLGRVTSRFVTPILETLADVMTVVTQALDNIIPKDGPNPFETFIRDTIPEAIETFVKLTDIIKIIGKELEDPIDVAATAIRKFGNTISDTFKNFGEVVKVRAEEIFDRLATAVRKLALDIEEFVVNLGNSLAESEIGKALGLSSTFYKKGASPAERKEQEDKNFADRQGRRDATLAQFYSTSDAQNKIEDDLLKDRQTARKKELKALADAAVEHDHIAEDIKTALSKAGDTRAKLNTITKEFVDAYIKFKEQSNAADERFRTGQAQARKSFDDANAKAQGDYNEAMGKLDSDFMDSQIKATRAFHKQEEKEQTAAAKERVRILKDLEQRLTDLAATRDVAGFIQAQREGKRQLDEQAEQTDDAAKERLAAFEEQQEEARENYKQQREELRSNLDKQLSANRKAYDEQLRELRQKHDEEKRAAMTAYAEQLAMLQGSNAQLNATYAQHYARMSAEAEAFVARNQATLNKLYQGATGTNSASNTDATIAQVEAAQQTASYQQAQKRNAGVINDLLGKMPRFHSGGVMPFDGLARLRKGEVITPPEQRGATGQPITVYVNNTVGDVATKSMLDRATDYIVEQTAAGLRNAIVPGGASG